MGEVLDIDKEDYGMHVRVRISMEVSRPIRRGMKIRDEDRWLHLSALEVRAPSLVLLCLWLFGP